jgi:hypothetical protein
MIAEKFIEMTRKLKYPSMDENKVREIEDMAGKQNRIDTLENYKNEIRLGRHKYNEDSAKIDQEFKLTLFKEYGVENHPKREKVFSMAWEKGYASGYSEIELNFEELVELIVGD